jgi:hypothetical protein
MLEYLSSEARREVIKKAYTSPSDLAAALDPRYEVTPALELIGETLEQVILKPRHNALITMPPQEGKSTVCSVYTPLRALQHDIGCRTILACHSDGLAEEASMMCRTLIGQHGSGVSDPVTGVEMEDKLGYRIAGGQNKKKSWKVKGGRGGMLAVGWGGGITGRPADLFIIDDLIKNPMEADSVLHRKKMIEWYTQVATTRLSPQASVVLVMTRWHEEDLAGFIIELEKASAGKFKTWKHINIPAIAEPGVPDALNREPGTVMISARGRTKEQFEATRRTVGERVWYAMYQGAPKAPEGGLFNRAWFDPPMDIPAAPVATIVAIDPADTGENDDTGIIAAAASGDGRIVFTEDWSGKFTSDVWGRRAVTLALQSNAREIAFEAYSTATTYEQVLKRAYREMHEDALIKHRAGVELTALEMRALSEVPPFTIYKWRAGAKIDAVGRSAYLRQALETRKAGVVYGKMDKLIDDACGWWPGQHQPDRVSAAVVGHDRLAKMTGGHIGIATPINDRPDPLQQRMNPVAPPIGLARRLGRGH